MSKGWLGAAVIVATLAIVSVAPPHVAHAWDWGTITYDGTVTRPDGTPVANLMVEATDCLNSPSDFTDAHGYYRIDGSPHLCFQSPMTISTHIQYSPDLAAKDKNTLIDVVTTATSSIHHVNTKNIHMKQHTIPVPEYGWLGGIVAGGSAIGVVAYMRRRYGKAAALKTIR
jgi:hypothetical protein